MKLLKISCLFIGALVLFAFVTPGSGSEDKESPGYLGVRLMPVPELLRVHLGLDEGAGQLVVNIVKNSPADKAGLTQYDVITAVGGREVGDYSECVEGIQSAGAGTKLTLTIITRGKKKNIKVRLAEAPTDEPDWKYEKTPLGITRRAKPRVYERKDFRIHPFEGDEPPSTLPEKLRRFFRREFYFRQDPNEGGIVITPNDESDRLDKLEQRLEQLRQRQEQILEKLQELLEEK